MTSDEMLKTDLPQGHIFHNKAKLGNKPDWEIVPKRSPRRMSYDTKHAVITIQVELKKSRGGELYFLCTSSRKAHSSQRIEYSYSETDPFYFAATSYLSRHGFNEDFGCVVRSHFDRKPDVKIFSFVK